MVGHPTRSRYILKDQIMTLVDADILKLRPEKKRVSANMTSYTHIGLAPKIITKVESIPQAELQILNMDPDNQKEKGYLYIPTPNGGRMCLRPHLFYTND